MKSIALLALTIVIVPVVLRFLYGVFLQDLETKLRGYLARNRPLWRRKKVVRAFVGAIRGHADASDALVRASFAVFLTISLAGAMGVAGSEMLRLNKKAVGVVSDAAKEVSEMDALFKRLDAMRKERDELLEGKSEIVDGYQKEHVGSGPSEPLVGREQQALLRTKLKGLIEEFEAGQPRAKAAVIVTFIAAGWFALLSLFLLHFWLPLMVATRVFTFEVSRFMARISAIATPTEIGKLAVVESRVTDEDSLKAFVGFAVDVARAHGVEALALRFDLWDAFAADRKQ